MIAAHTLPHPGQAALNEARQEPAPGDFYLFVRDADAGYLAYVRSP